MSDSLGVWSKGEVVRAYGLPEQSREQAEAGLVSTAFGLARPVLYQDNQEFLHSLVPLLTSSAGKLGRLSLSQVLSTRSGQYTLARDDQTLCLATWETGPVCDPHNTFELFTVLAGVAHWHQLTGRPGHQVLDAWQERYQGLLQESTQLSRHPDLNKRALRYWEDLLDTWRNCIKEGLALISQVKGSELAACVSLGVESFADFIYLPGLHRVHYNWVDRCRVGLPTEDLAALLGSCEGDLQVMESMLLSYTKVRSLSLSERKLVLAELWLPGEISLENLQAPNLNILALRRMQAALERRMTLVSDLEDVLCLPAADHDCADSGSELAREEDNAEEVLIVAQRGTRNASRKATSEEARPSLSAEAIDSGQVGSGPDLITIARDQSKTETRAVEEEKPMDEEKVQVEAEEVAVTPETADSVAEASARPTKKVMVWKPFPRPLNAPPEPLVAEPVEQIHPEEEPVAPEEQE